MISKNILDGLAVITSIFTIFASVATLIALFIAWRMWKTWKIQQTYTLHREKLIENEINIIALYHYQGNVMKQMIEIANIDLNNRILEESETQNYKETLARIQSKQGEFEDRYGFCLFTLERYGIFYPDKLKFDITAFRNKTREWINRVSSCENIDELNILTKEYYYSSAAERDEFLNGLAKFRQTSLQ